MARPFAQWVLPQFPSEYMKRLFFLCFLVASSQIVHATSYYVATSGGSDSNNGTSLTTPFKTIQKAAGLMVAGDTCYVRAGTYRETVTPAHSGASGQPITFSNYNGEVVTVSGADAITSWTVNSGSVYKAAMGWDLGKGMNQVFVDGKMMNEARWPNPGLDPLHPVLAKVQSSPTFNEIDDANLTQAAGYWNGATIWIEPGQNSYNPWVAKTGTVTSYTPGKIITDFASSTDTNNLPAAGNYYYLTFGPLSSLDSAGEWQLSSSTLYLWTPDGTNPSGHTVEAKHRTYAFNFTNLQNIVLTGFDVFSAGVTLSGATNCLVDQCDFKYLSHFTLISSGWDTADSSGVVVSGSGNTVRHCWVDTSAGNGISLLGSNNTVIDCTVHEVDYDGIDSCGIRAFGNALEVKRNTVYNAGRAGILNRNLTASRIEYNDISKFALFCKDVGGTYCFHTDGQGTVISHNWSHDTGTGLFNTNLVGVAGLYLDNNSLNHVVEHNLCWNTYEGIRMNPFSHTNDIYNNDFYNNPGGSLTGGGDFDGTRVINNIFSGSVASATYGTTGSNANNINSGTDPKYVNPAGLDFELQSTSPAINAGQVLSPYTDGYIGSAPDIGAYENGNPRWTAGARYEAETLVVPNSSGDTVRVFAGDFLSDGNASIIDANAVGDYVTYLVPNLPQGSYHVFVGTKKFASRGQFQLSVGRADNFSGTASNVGSVQDGYIATEAYTEFDLGTWAPGTTSDKWFRFTVTGKNAASSGYTIAVDYIRLAPY